MNTRLSMIRKALCVFLLMCFAPGVAFSAVHIINVVDSDFRSEANNTGSITIQVGDTVRWVNAAGGLQHDVTSNTGAWVPPPTSPEFTFEIIFDSPGSFAYFCTVHTFMTGIITVEAAASAELDLQSVDATAGTYASADMLTIDTTIMNSGTAGSGMFSIDYYASTDNVISEDDILLASENIGDIAMGATLNHQAMVGVSAIVVAGDYFIGAIITFTDGNAADNSNVDATAVTFLGLFFINAGLNDAWVHDGAPLQGFFFTVFPDIGFLFFAWFTFDSVPPDETVPPAEFGANDQRWVSGLGAIVGDSVTISVELTSGGVFNASEPEATQEKNYGTITIVFINCDEALLTYNFPSLGLMGQMTLHRVLTDNVPLCQVLNAELQMMQ